MTENDNRGLLFRDTVGQSQGKIISIFSQAGKYGQTLLRMWSNSFFFQKTNISLVFENKLLHVPLTTLNAHTFKVLLQYLCHKCMFNSGKLITLRGASALFIFTFMSLI